MNLREFYYKYEIKLVGLHGKKRITSKARGYASIDEYGCISHPKSWKTLERSIDNYGVICDYIPSLKLYYSVLDIDSRDFPVMELLEKYPTGMTNTKHGYHLHLLSPVPCSLKQLTGRDKERCPVDIRAKRDSDPSKEGNYVRENLCLIGDTTPLLVVDFNEVVKYVYALFGITAKERGEYASNVQVAELIMQNNNIKNNTELFLASYLYFQKENWESAYDSAFPFGIQLAGWLNKESLQRVGFHLMRISGYKAPRKWVTSFLTGYCTGDKGYPHFGKEDLKPEMKVFLNKRFHKLKETEIKELAKLLQNVKLYQILEVIR